MTELKGSLKKTQQLSGGIKNSKALIGKMNNSKGGIQYYAELPDKPFINDVELLGNISLDELNIQEKNDFATKLKAGVVIVGDNLSIDNNGKLSVETVDQAEEDNTKPMTSAGVYVELGNINELLSKI